LVIPEKYTEIANGICEDNDKFKNFIDNSFDITRDDSDRMQVDEFMEMYNRHSKCNYAWSTVHSDLKRLGIEFNRDKSKMVNGISQKRCIIGIKPKSQVDEVEFVNEWPDPSGLDSGLPCETLKDDECLRLYLQKEKECNDLKDAYEVLRLEFEAYKKQYPPVKKATIRLIDDSDDESEVILKDNKIVDLLKVNK